MAGPTPRALSAATGIAPWFSERLAELVEAERAGRGDPLLDAKRARLWRRRDRRALGRAAGGRAPRAGPGRDRPAYRGRHLRGRVPGRDALLLLSYDRPEVAPPSRAAERDRGRLRTDPDRAGDRVRLLLRARGVGDPRDGPGRGGHQQQPRDGLDRLRRLLAASTSSRSTRRACSTSSTTSGR